MNEIVAIFNAGNTKQLLTSKSLFTIRSPSLNRFFKSSCSVPSFSYSGNNVSSVNEVNLAAEVSMVK